MPIYEYQCTSCHRKFEVNLSYSEYGETPVVCPHCSSGEAKRLIGRIRITRSSHEHLANLADPSSLDMIDEDPRALGRMMREMKSDVGADLGGEFDEVVDRLEKGQTPDEIDRAFPDIASNDGLE
jgi:putative FmdB family regulatory protein